MGLCNTIASLQHQGAGSLPQRRTTAAPHNIRDEWWWPSHTHFLLPFPPRLFPFNFFFLFRFMCHNKWLPCVTFCFVLQGVSIKRWVSICWSGVVSWGMGWGLDLCLTNVGKCRRTKTAAGRRRSGNSVEAFAAEISFWSLPTVVPFLFSVCFDIHVVCLHSQLPAPRLLSSEGIKYWPSPPSRPANLVLLI